MRGHHAIALAIALAIGSQRMLIIMCATWCEASHHATADASAHDEHTGAQHVSTRADRVSASDECHHVFARSRPGSTHVVFQPAIVRLASAEGERRSSAQLALSVTRIAADHGPPITVLRI